MKSNRLSAAKIFFLSVGISLVLTVFLEPFYFQFFEYYGGGWLSSREFESYPVTFLFLYAFLFSFLYAGFSGKFIPSHFITFVAIPVLAFTSSPTDRLLVGVGILIAGLIIGHFVKKRA